MASARSWQRQGGVAPLPHASSGSDNGRCRRSIALGMHSTHCQRSVSEVAQVRQMPRATRASQSVACRCRAQCAESVALATAEMRQSTHVRAFVAQGVTTAVVRLGPSALVAATRPAAAVVQASQQQVLPQKLNNSGVSPIAVAATVSANTKRATRSFLGLRSRGHGIVQPSEFGETSAQPGGLAQMLLAPRSRSA